MTGRISFSLSLSAHNTLSFENRNVHCDIVVNCCADSLIKMASSTLIEVFSPIVFSFTRGVTENCNPEEPEFTAESFGYNPLESTGREWYYHPVDELIYQEYSDREATHLDHLARSSLNITVINACSPVENREELGDKQGED